MLHTVEQDALTWMLHASAQLVQTTLQPDEAATFGDLIAGDTKHIIGWVKENNPGGMIGCPQTDAQRPKRLDMARNDVMRPSTAAHSPTRGGVMRTQRRSVPP